MLRDHYFNNSLGTGRFPSITDIESFGGKRKRRRRKKFSKKSLAAGKRRRSSRRRRTNRQGKGCCDK